MSRINSNLPTQKAMDLLLEEISAGNKVPTLLLHSCCAPCSSYVLEYLSSYFEIYDFYYNPNIGSKEEYEHREQELSGLIERMPLKNPVHFIEGRYEPEVFYQKVKGYEKCPERGARCEICFDLRLRESAKKCKELGCDYFATTLTISPLKDAITLNRIGEAVGNEIGVTYLPSDFKKKGGYQRSIQLSKEYELYRQSFCGCVFSKGEQHEES
ncbi:MAG: epoxyqueuosine reductase QueH [Lachnospiraceae bacterium]|nr:epoxyqueuosine reductase QueH [Lachnospiraceae bacterium]